MVLTFPKHSGLNGLVYLFLKWFGSSGSQAWEFINGLVWFLFSINGLIQFGFKANKLNWAKPIAKSYHLVCVSKAQSMDNGLTFFSAPCWSKDTYRLH